MGYEQLSRQRRNEICAMPNPKISNAIRFRHWLKQDITWSFYIAKALTNFELKLTFWGQEANKLKQSQHNAIYLEQGTKQLQKARELFTELWQQEKRKCAANGGHVNEDAWKEYTAWIEQCPPNVDHAMASLGQFGRAAVSS